MLNFPVLNRHKTQLDIPELLKNYTCFDFSIFREQDN